MSVGNIQSFGFTFYAMWHNFFLLSPKEIISRSGKISKLHIFLCFYMALIVGYIDHSTALKYTFNYLVFFMYFFGGGVKNFLIKTVRLHLEPNPYQ